MEIIDAFLSSGIRFTTPILLVALACLPTAWTKDFNVGLEGALLFGAFFGVAFGVTTQNLYLAIVLTLVFGALSGLIFGVLVAVLNVNVFVAGIVLNVFAAGATVYLLRGIYGVAGTLSDVDLPTLRHFTIPVIENIPVLGAVLSGHTAITYLSWFVVLGLALAARYTTVVRHMKASGEHPQALLTAGGNVTGMRIVAQIWCFVLCGLAGIQLSLGQLSMFTEGMSGGIGFVALAAVFFSRGRVNLLVTMSVLFGLATAVSILVSADIIPPQLPQMLPYVTAFIGLVWVAKRSPADSIRIVTPKLEEVK